MIVLGIHAALTAKSHEPSAALLIDGRLVGAIEEERLNRIKTSIGFFPAKAVGELLAMEGLAVADIDYVFSDGITYTGMAHKINRYMKSLGDFRGKVELVDHAYSHAVGAFLSGQEQHGIAFSIDGVGDGVSTLVLEIDRDYAGTLNIRELYRGGLEESLGCYYNLFTNHLGFRSIQDEYKVMGMAAYGSPNIDLSQLLKFDTKAKRVLGSFQSCVEDNFYS
jgi:carbamoyltransferase